MTNREKLAQKSNEEIGKFISSFEGCINCPIFAYCTSGNGEDVGTCAEVIAMWLGEEAEK